MSGQAGGRRGEPYGCDALRTAGLSAYAQLMGVSDACCVCCHGQVDPHELALIDTTLPGGVEVRCCCHLDALLSDMLADFWRLWDMERRLRGEEAVGYRVEEVLHAAP